MTEERNKILKDEEEFHDKWAKKIDPNNLSVLDAFEGPVSPEYHFAVKLLGNLKDKKILNPGCGTGEEAIYLTKKGGHVLAIDISSEMIKVAQGLAKRFRLEKIIIFNKMNAESLLFENKSFDLIFGNSILHHINIRDAAKEFSRVLKFGGKAVFIEPLFYNPIINCYRKIANLVRTPNEHPLKFKDISIFNKYFKKVNHYEFQFSTLLIFCYFFLIQGLHPNKDRYWKKIIKEGKQYREIFYILFNIDRVLLRIFPFLKRYCWVTVIYAEK